MKEATGELSTTAIAVVAIAAIGVVFSQLIWPQIKASVENTTKCNSAFNCTGDASAGGLLTCDYYDSDGNVVEDGIQCPSSAKGTY